MLNDFRQILLDEYNKKKTQGRNYTMARFASDLELSPSQLSEIFQNKKGISLKKAEIIVEKLKFDSNLATHFCDLVEAETARSPMMRNLAQAKLKHRTEGKYSEVDLETFETISSWQHFAILVVLNMPSFDGGIDELATALKISKKECEEAVEKLIHIKFVKFENGKLKATLLSGTVRGGVPSDYIKAFHTGVLEKASDALYSQPVDERYFKSGFIKCNKKSYEKARTMIDECWHKVDDEVSLSEDNDKIYCLALQLFNVAELHKDK